MTLLHPGPAYRIVTKRTVVRCWDPADAPLLKTAVEDNLDHLRPWMPWAEGEPPDLDERIHLLRTFRSQFDLGEDFVYGIFDSAETRVIGGTGLHTRVGKDAREIGYWIHKDFINQGYATEISAALTKVAFEINHVRRVEIQMAIENAASAAIPRKLGFTHEAILRQREFLADGRFHDLQVWTMLDTEYPNSPCARAGIHAYDAIGRQLL